MWEEKRILIWGKTYPEISSKYYETVCTGGVFENGDFIRLYPIPFRYLDDARFAKYQWIRARVKKSQEDPRKESYKIDPESIKIEESIPPDKFEWFNRSRPIFQNGYYSFNTVEQLFAENKANNTSMGFVRPTSIEKIYLSDRPQGDYDTFVRKMSENQDRRRQFEMFDEVSVAELKQLRYLSQRFKVHWKCQNPACKSHKMSILDWELYELVRKTGTDRAMQRLKETLDLAQHNVGFFLGNFKLHPNNFAIGSIWYPKKSNLAPNLRLFD